MMHKYGWVFNVPVDAEGLGLHDYHIIVKEPMDLGTVRAKLEKSLYNSPLDFARDDVHGMAKSLLSVFEEKWISIESQFDNLHWKFIPQLSQQDDENELDLDIDGLDIQSSDTGSFKIMTYTCSSNPLAKTVGINTWKKLKDNSYFSLWFHSSLKTTDLNCTFGFTYMYEEDGQQTTFFLKDIAQKILTVIKKENKGRIKKITTREREGVA
ncbi:hypothetical protein Bca52824_078828 [Brassica carinata]|uniref:Bromo domain-containing protein n=1 Tax=Brassica carinata TaxID=52824 RepID=A0A8X7PW80_BRACI|nr:hypothetical protein Bca52824_078828 [Brassica carinata]